MSQESKDKADAAAESFWKEDFKRVLRDDYRQHIDGLLGNGTLAYIYKRRFKQDYRYKQQFIDRIVDMMTIGAENGADAAMDDIFNAFLTESRLPQARRYASYLLPEALPPALEKKVHDAVIEEYGREKVFRHAYRVGYKGDFRSFALFISKIADIAVAGVLKGADDMLGRIYGAFWKKTPLTPARRNPKRLRSW